MKRTRAANTSAHAVPNKRTSKRRTVPEEREQEEETTASASAENMGHGTILSCLLRGVNVGGKRMAMASLSELLTGEGLVNPKTYIQSGNAVFLHPKGHALELSALPAALSSAIENEFGYEVPVILKTLEQLKAVTTRNPFLTKELKSSIEMKAIYTVFLEAEMSEDVTEQFEKYAKLFDPEANPGLPEGNDDLFIVSPTLTEIYLYCQKAGYGKTKLTNNVIEKVLGMNCTTRNWNTCLKLVDMMETHA
ncbi:hypothetical protein BJ741DRAFT_598082, partial [Chytriomyces cf. hyalinus JEL632]